MCPLVSLHRWTTLVVMLYVPTRFDTLLGVVHSVEQVKKPIDFPVNSIVDFHVNGIRVSFMGTFTAIFLKHIYLHYQICRAYVLCLSLVILSGYLWCTCWGGIAHQVPQCFVYQSFPRIIEQTSRHAVCLDLLYSHAHRTIVLSTPVVQILKIL